MKWLPFEDKKQYLNTYSKKNNQNHKVKNKNILKSKIINFSQIIFFLAFLTLIQVGLNLSKLNNELSMKSKANEITIKINGTGNLYIVKYNFYNAPNSIYLNDNLQRTHTTAYKSIFIPTDGQIVNTVKLVWDNKLISLNKIFYGLLHLLEADLSNLDTSLVTNMEGMFYNCQSLTSVNLANLNTTLIENMGFAFYNCLYLAEVDLSSFDTSKVTKMDNMFLSAEI